jgi:hypothetical protein
MAAGSVWYRLLVRRQRSASVVEGLCVCVRSGEQWVPCLPLDLNQGYLALAAMVVSLISTQMSSMMPRTILACSTLAGKGVQTRSPEASCVVPLSSSSPLPLLSCCFPFFFFLFSSSLLESRQSLIGAWTLDTPSHLDSRLLFPNQSFVSNSSYS